MILFFPHIFDEGEMILYSMYRVHQYVHAFN